MKRIKTEKKMLPIHIIDIIMSFNGRELYWNKYTKQTQIRFIPRQFGNLSYLFRHIEKTFHHDDKNDYEIVCRRSRLVLRIHSCPYDYDIFIIITADKAIGSYFHSKIEYDRHVISLSKTSFYSSDT